MSTARLESTDPQLAEALRNATDPARRRAAAAIKTLRLEDPRIREAESLLGSNRDGSAEREALRALRDRLDEGHRISRSRSPQVGTPRSSSSRHGPSPPFTSLSIPNL